MAGVELTVDYSGVEALLGDGLGVIDAVDSPSYMGQLIAAAVNVASMEFDVDAASAAAGGQFTHMYEFGTNGITRGTPIHMDPTSLEARLFEHTTVVTGDSVVAGYIFRSAVTPNPKPSATFYGVSYDIISKLSRRNYVFKRRAEVVELGETVRIKPTDKPWNFVPFYGEESHDPDNDRGYVFFPKEKGPMLSTPGEGGHSPALAGTFTKFWNAWWESTGTQLLARNANEYFNKDVASVMLRYPADTIAPESVLRYNSRGRVYNRRRRVKAKMLRVAAVRGNNRRR